MAQSSDPGREAPSDWPRAGEEGFVHFDGTPGAHRQRADNDWVKADREAKRSGVHGAPALGGVQPGAPVEQVATPAKPADTAK